MISLTKLSRGGRNWNSIMIQIDNHNPLQDLTVQCKWILFVLRYRNNRTSGLLWYSNSCKYTYISWDCEHCLLKHYVDRFNNNRFIDSKTWLVELSYAIRTTFLCITRQASGLRRSHYFSSHNHRSQHNYILSVQMIISENLIWYKFSGTDPPNWCCLLWYIS